MKKNTTYASWISQFNFIEASKYSGLFSGGFLLLGLILYMVFGGFQYGIDFTGGTQLEINLNESSSVTKLRNLISNDIEINSASGSTQLFIFKLKIDPGKNNQKSVETLMTKNFIPRLKKNLNKNVAIQTKYQLSSVQLTLDISKITDNKKDDILQALKNSLKDLIESHQFNRDKDIIQLSLGFTQLLTHQKIITPLKKVYPKLEINNETSYEPTFGQAIRNQALWISLFVLILILLYIGLRFQFRYGIAAIVALLHDIFSVLTTIILFGQEVDTTTIIALLSIMGYSLNDTIIVFDRIRENRHLWITENKSDVSIVNRSIYQSLRRTVITSLTTLAVVSCLLIFGGNSLYNLSFALFVGIIIGTYSSIFVASPILVMWEQWIEKKEMRKKK